MQQATADSNKDIFQETIQSKMSFTDALSAHLKHEADQNEFNNQITTFGKLLKRKESILFFNDVVKQVSETRVEKLK